MLHILTHCGSQLTKKGHDSEEVSVSTVAVVEEFEVILELEAGRSLLQIFQLQHRDCCTVARGCEPGLWQGSSFHPVWSLSDSHAIYPDHTAHFPAHG